LEHDRYLADDITEVKNQVTDLAIIESIRDVHLLPELHAHEA